MSTFNWSTVNDETTGHLDEYQFKFGDASEANQKIRYETISIFRGSTKLRKATHPHACYFGTLTPTSSNRCTLETLYTPK